MASLSKIKLAALLSAATAIVPSQARTCLPAFKATISYVGCYHDPLSPRDLSGPFLWPGDTNSPQHCADLCGAAGYGFSGVEFGVQCFCGQKITAGAVKAQSESECNMPCPAAPSSVCGGGNMINIYQITNPLATALNPALPDCTRDPLCSNDVCDTSLSIGDRASALVKAMTLEEKIPNLNSAASGAPRVGLPSYNWQNEALHGLAGGQNAPFQVPLGSDFSAATSFPMPILLSAAFDDDLVRNVGEVISTEARAFANAGMVGFDFWTPNINPFRDPRWGRGQETPGEDPFRTSQYVLALIDGLQGGLSPDYFRVLATCKHFAAYDVENNREANDVSPSKQDMADFYLPMFETCVRDAHAASIMCAYNSVNGVPACASSYLLEDVLREGWEFQEPYNYVVSDCDSVKDVFDPHKYAADLAHASALSLNAGTDLDCGTTYGDNLNVSVTKGLTSEAVIDTALTRLVAAQIKVGLFDHPSEYASLSWSDVNTTASRNTAYLAAAEGSTLLKNDGTLPLSRTLKNVAIIGPWANVTDKMQGNYIGIAPLLANPLDVFKQHWQNVQYAPGADINSASTGGFSAALTAARNADVIIYMGGLDGSVENEGFDRSSIAWPGNQLSLIQQLAALGKKLVVIQFGGGQVDDSALLSNAGVNSILWFGYPGQEGGNAIFDVLTGTYPPAGRLPATQYPSSYTGKYTTLDMSLRPGTSTPGRTYMWYSSAVLPFGYGLSYTKWQLSWVSQPAASTDISALGASITVSVNVKNSGTLSSDFVVLLFASSTDAGPAPHPIKQLVSYTRLKAVGAGQTQQASVNIDVNWLARADTNGNRFIYPGTYKLSVDTGATISATFSLTGTAKQVSTLPTQGGGSGSVNVMNSHPVLP